MNNRYDYLFLGAYTMLLGGAIKLITCQKIVLFSWNLKQCELWDPSFFFWTLSLRLKESKELPKEKLEGKHCSPFQPNQLSDFVCDCIINHFALTQVNEGLTHSKSILDLKIIGSPKNITDIDIGKTLTSSDHNIINFTFNYQRKMSITTIKSGFQLQKCKLRQFWHRII